MTSKTRKRLRPVSLLMAVAIVGVVAAFLMVASSPTSTQAHDNGVAGDTHCDDLGFIGKIAHDEDPNNDHDCATGVTPTATTPPTLGPEMPDAMIESSSTTGGAGVELILTIGSLPMDAVAGSSVELYLEDDFQVPDSIARDTVYFTVPGGGIDQNGGGRVYTADPVEIDDDDHFGGDDDWSIRVFIPDMNNAENSGYNGPEEDQTLKLVFTKAAGIKNPTEAGTHSVGYSVLGANDEANDGPMVELDDVDMSGAPLETKAKISLSDEDAGRGKEITVTGTGFNNGTNAEVRVYVSEAAEAPSCAMVMTMGEKLGAAPVGSDDKFVVSFTVHQDEFDAGAVNYICAADSEAGAPRMASAVKVFELEPSVSVSPDSASFGDEVTLKPRDFMDDISSITLGPSCVWTAASGDNDCFTATPDGSDFVFDLPGDLDEQIQIAVTDGNDTKRIYMGVVPSSLELSQTEVAPNASVIISGSGFTENARVYTDMITIDGKATGRERRRDPGGRQPPVPAGHQQR